MSTPRPKGVSRDQAEANIVPGKILCLYVCFPHENIPHDKYMIVVGFDESPLLLKINTKSLISKTDIKLREYQFGIKKSQYPFLHHDSYLDCGTVWYNLLSKEEIINQLINDSQRILGDILEDHKNEIVKFTALSRSISSLHKRIIAQSFRK